MKEKIVSGKKKGSLCRKGVIGLYVCSGLSLICGIFMMYYSITYVQSYYDSYGMSISDGIKDVLQYVISNTGSYIGFAILLFTAGVILKKADQIHRVMQKEELPAVEEPAAQEASSMELDASDEVEAVEAEEPEAEEPQIEAIEEPKETIEEEKPEESKN